MMNKVMRDICDAFSVKYDVYPVEAGENSAFSVTISDENFGDQQVLFIYQSGTERVHMQIRTLLQVDPSERLALLPELNRINALYRFLRFSCDQDGHVRADYVFPRNAVDLAESAVELVEKIGRPILSGALRSLKKEMSKVVVKDSGDVPVLAHVRRELEDNDHTCEYDKANGVVVTKIEVHDRTFEIRFTHAPEEGLSVRLEGLKCVARAQYDKAKDLVWLLNRRMDDVRFELDEACSINLCYDFPEEDDDPSDEACHVVRMITDAARIVLPLLDKELPMQSGRREGCLEAVRDELDQHGYHCDIFDIDERFRELSVMISVGDDWEMVSFIERDGKVERVRLFQLISLTDWEKKIRVEALLADLDSRTELLSFVCDKDGDVNLCYDYPDDSEDVASGACDMVRRFVDAANMAAPILQEFRDED